MTTLSPPGALRACLAALLAHTPTPFELVLVDDGSPPAVRDSIETLCAPVVHLTHLRNQQRQGLLFARNQGLAAAFARGARHLVLIDDHFVVSEGWAHRMLAALAIDPALGAVGPATQHGSGLQSNARGTMLGRTGTPPLARAPRLRPPGRPREPGRAVPGRAAGRLLPDDDPHPD